MLFNRVNSLKQTFRSVMPSDLAMFLSHWHQILTPEKLTLEVTVNNLSNSWDFWVYPTHHEPISGEEKIRVVQRLRWANSPIPAKRGISTAESKKRIAFKGNGGRYPNWNFRVYFGIRPGQKARRLTHWVLYVTQIILRGQFSDRILQQLPMVGCHEPFGSNYYEQFPGRDKTYCSGYRRLGYKPSIGAGFRSKGG